MIEKMKGYWNDAGLQVSEADRKVHKTNPNVEFDCITAYGCLLLAVFITHVICMYGGV